MSSALMPCPDCGAAFPALDGPTHPYLGGSAGCWAAFGELTARELGLGIAGPERLSVHAYAVQHHGLPGRRQAQSVDVHLMVLATVIERDSTTAGAVAAMPGWLRGRAVWPWLQPPLVRPSLTIASLPQSLDRAAHIAAVRAWAADIWSAWSLHRTTVIAWLDAASRHAATVKGAGGRG